MRRNCSVITEPGEDRYYVVHVPALPGCITQGRTEDEARANAKEAIEASLESYGKHNRPIPARGSVRITGSAVEVRPVPGTPLLPARKVIRALVRPGFSADHQRRQPYRLEGRRIRNEIVAPRTRPRDPAVDPVVERDRSRDPPGRAAPGGADLAGPS